MGVHGQEKEAVPEPGQRAEGGKFLSFFLGKEEYAIEILKVQEIIGLMAITPVPQMPAYIRGVLNLRGRIIPVMDLRFRFSLPRVEDTNESCVIVIREGAYRMGVVVDKVSEVVDIAGEQIEDVPSFGNDSQTGYLAGIARFNSSVKLIVNIHQVVFEVPESVLKSQEMGHLE